MGTKNTFIAVGGLVQWRYIQNARSCPNCSGRNINENMQEHQNIWLWQCRERLLSVGLERRPPPPRLNCPLSLSASLPPSSPLRASLHQISTRSRMISSHLEFTTTPTTYIYSTSRALAAGATLNSTRHLGLQAREDASTMARGESEAGAWSPPAQPHTCL